MQSVSRKLESSVDTIEQIVSNLKDQVIAQDSLIKGTIKTITQDYLNKYRVTDQDGQDANNSHNNLPGRHTSDNMLDGGFERAANFH